MFNLSSCLMFGHHWPKMWNWCYCLKIMMAFILLHSCHFPVSCTCVCFLSNLEINGCMKWQFCVRTHDLPLLMCFLFRKDTSPIVEGCCCYTCQNHTKAYINHLLNVHEMLAQTLIEMYKFSLVLTIMIIVIIVLVIIIILSLMLQTQHTPLSGILPCNKRSN